MITLSLLYFFVALAVLTITAKEEFGNTASGIVMKAEGDGGSNSDSGDDLGWGNGDVDLPF